MEDEYKKLKIIVSGGGTGGHIFPAIAIAEAVQKLRPNAEILFVGAEGRMEMQRVPAAGYRIVGLPISGFDRKRIWRNIGVLCKLMKARRIAASIIREFRPSAVVGVGGYASGPTLDVAGRRGIPTLIQEQNSYAGITNKLLARRAQKICVAYEGMERFFPKEKIILTGNPVRANLLTATPNRAEVLGSFGLRVGVKTVLVIGGSLGARTINEAMLTNLQKIADSGAQFIWQTGSFYYERIKSELDEVGCPSNIHVTNFVLRMEDAYAVADLVVSRAGAGSISELCLLGKPAILIPSPNVSEDHQTKNAMALVNKGAALCVSDAEACNKLVNLALQTISNSDKLMSLSVNAKRLAFSNATERIAELVVEMAEKYIEGKERRG